MARLRFPELDARAFAAQGYQARYYRAAAVCRRGHAAEIALAPNEPYPEDAKCTKCGALVLVGCPNCGLRIRGRLHIPMVVVGGNWSRPSFCDECGGAYPWATREERIFEIENILDEDEDLDEATKVFLHDRLRDLREAEGLDEKREWQLWGQIRERSGAFLTSEPVRRITETLITAAVRAHLGI